MNTTTISDVNKVTDTNRVELGTFVWIGDTPSIYILGRMTGDGYSASLVSLENGNLWHISSRSINKGYITLKDLEEIIGNNDWGFVSGFTVKQER